MCHFVRQLSNPLVLKHKKHNEWTLTHMFFNWPVSVDTCLQKLRHLLVTYTATQICVWTCLPRPPPPRPWQCLSATGWVEEDRRQKQDKLMLLDDKTQCHKQSLDMTNVSQIQAFCSPGADTVGKVAVIWSIGHVTIEHAKPRFKLETNLQAPQAIPATVPNHWPSAECSQTRHGISTMRALPYAPYCIFCQNCIWTLAEIW